jgi:hypothetical protein
MLTTTEGFLPSGNSWTGTGKSVEHQEMTIVGGTYGKGTGSLREFKMA